MRVLHLITGLGQGGAETMLFKLLAALDQGRFHCRVISLLDRGVLGERIEALGVPVTPLGLRGPWDLPKALLCLGEAVRASRPEVLQGWMYHGNLAAWCASLIAPGRPALIFGIRQSAYDLSTEKRATASVIRIGARLSSRADAIVYNSEIARTQHEALGYRPARGQVIPNGFDTTRFAPSPEARLSVRGEHGLAPDTPLVGLMGRFHPMKDHAGFIAAASLVLRQHDNTHFLLAGEGVHGDNQALHRAIDATGHADAFHLLGRRDDMARLNAALDVAVCASAYNEGFPNVIGEAMSCGVPCVVTAVGDSADIVGVTGRVVPPRSPERLAEAINVLLALPSEARQALGRAARQRVVEHYSIGSVAYAFAALYQRLLAR